MTGLPDQYANAVQFTFGDSPELADELLALVRSGTKTATCGALEGYGDDEPFPVVGRRDVVLDGKGRVHAESIGLPLEEDMDQFLAETREDVTAALAKLKGGQRHDHEAVTEAARLAARRAASRWSGKKPQVRVILAEQ